MEKPSKTQAHSPPKGALPSHDAIAARAYELWVKDGCPLGRAVYHWHEAERQLLSARLTDEASPYNSLQHEEPLNAQAEQDLSHTNIKSAPPQRRSR